MVNMFLNYCFARGKFTWTIGGFGEDKKSEVKTSSIVIGDELIPLARLAFFFMQDALPPKCLRVVHIDGDRDNNRWDNLVLREYNHNQAEFTQIFPDIFEATHVSGEQYYWAIGGEGTQCFAHTESGLGDAKRLVSVTDMVKGK